MSKEGQFPPATSLPEVLGLMVGRHSPVLGVVLDGQLPPSPLAEMFLWHIQEGSQVATRPARLRLKNGFLSKLHHRERGDLSETWRNGY